jgi:D-alanine-D-alanine ligase
VSARLRVGLTYDLRDDYLAEGYGEEETAEFDSVETVEAIAGALAARGFAVERIGHVRRLTEKLADGARWDFVFNIAEGLNGVGREAQVPALLDAYGIPYTFSDPLVLALTLDKAMTKRVLRDCGLATAPFAVAGDVAVARAIGLPYPIFVKPLAEGTGKGIGPDARCETPDALARAAGALIARFAQPVLVETYLPGREFTVGITGTGTAARSLGVMEVRFLPRAGHDFYSFTNKEHYEDRVAYALANDDEARRAEALALAAWRALGARDGGRVDLRSDAHGEPHVLELNPLAGLHPVRSDLVILAGLAGIGHRALIGRIVDSVLARHPALAAAARQPVPA